MPQRAAEVKEEVERKTSIPRGMTHIVHQGKMLNCKKTIAENSIGAEETFEMSLRMSGGTEENVSMGSLESLESEDERTLADEKKMKLEGKSTRPREDTMYPRKEIIEAIKRTNEKIETYSQKADEKMKNIINKWKIARRKQRNRCITFCKQSRFQSDHSL